MIIQNDLTSRDQADELVKLVPESLKKKIFPFLEEWDSRFKSATNVLKEPIFREDDPPWWWYRIPKKLIGELKDDVEAMKIR